MRRSARRNRVESIDQADDGLDVPFQTVAQPRVCPSGGPKARGEVAGRSRQRVIARSARPLLMRAPGRSRLVNAPLDFARQVYPCWGHAGVSQHFERHAQVAWYEPRV